MTDDIGITRRELIEVGVAAPALLAAGEAGAQAPEAGVPTARVTLTVNGRQESREVDTRTSLLDLLREHLGLTGSKKGCDHGQCGACTVILNGRRVNSCLTLAVMADGDRVTTIEGLGGSDRLHPMQEAFIKHDGFQCGYCTPGQICSAVAMLDEAKAGWASHATVDVAARPRLDDEEIRERMSGNLCRCSCYVGIFAAIKDAGGMT